MELKFPARTWTLTHSFRLCITYAFKHDVSNTKNEHLSQVYNYDVFYSLNFLMDCSKIRNMESLLNFLKNPT